MKANIDTGLLERARSAILQALPAALAIYVYGSVARGDSHVRSDIDLAVLLPPTQRITELLSLTGVLVESLGRDVNIVDLRRVGNILRKEVLQDGIAIYVQDKNVLLAWEAEAMSEYAEHRERIKEILDQVHETGVGYSQ